MLLGALALTLALVGYQLPLPEPESAELGTQEAVPEYLSTADMVEWGAPIDLCQECFPENKPAGTAVGLSGLSGHARVESECASAA